MQNRASLINGPSKQSANSVGSSCTSSISTPSHSPSPSASSSVLININEKVDNQVKTKLIDKESILQTLEGSKKETSELRPSVPGVFDCAFKHSKW